MWQSHGRTWVVPIVLLILTIATTALATADPTLDPTTVTDDYGNVANADSQITWAALPEGNYTGNKEYDDGQMERFIKMKDGFLDLLQDDMLDADLIADTLLGNITYAQAGKKAGRFLAGFGACLVLGLLFLLLFPLVGCCFCCCRLCGNCGGKRLQKEPSTCCCVSLTLMIDVSVTVIFVGGMMMVMMDDRMSFAIDYLDDAISDNLWDMGVFLNTTADQAEQVGLGGFNFSVKVIERDLNNIDYTLGLPIRDYLGNDLGVYDMLDDMIAMDTRIDNTIVQMQYVENNQTAWEGAHSALDTALSNLRSTLNGGAYLNDGDCTSDANCNALLTSLSTVDTLADPTLMPDLSTTITDLQNIQSSSNLTASVESGRRDFDNIPFQLQNDTQSQINDIVADLQGFSSDISDNLGDLTNLTQSTDDLDKIRDDMKKNFKTIKDYDSYRSMAFLGSVVLVFVITSLWLCGVILGPCCYRKHVRPTERHCCSNCAGLLLMSGAGLAWIFSLLLMLITFLLFLLGYPMHKFLCEPLTDPDYTVFKRLIDEPGSLLSKDGYYMGELVFNNGTINLTVSGVLEDCRKNKAAYEAMQLQHLIDLEQMVDWQDSMDIENTLDSMTTDLTNIEIMTNDTQDILLDMKDALDDLNYTAMRTVLSADVTATDLSQWLSDLQAVVTNIAGTDATLSSNLDAEATTLQDIINNEYAAADTAQSDEYDAVVLLESIAGDIPDDIDQLIADANGVEANLTTYGDQYVAQVVGAFANRITGIVFSFSNYTYDQFTTEMARCEPVWNVWDAIIRSGFCDLTVGTLNGVWFSLGWCTFFMFLSIIFSIKLAKFFRKMKYEEEDEDDKDGDPDDDDQEPDPWSYDHYGGPQKQTSGPAPAASNFGPPMRSKPGMPNSPPPNYSSHANARANPAANRNLNF